MANTDDRAVRPGDFRPHRIWNLWPLWVFLLALAAVGHWIWLRRPQILLKMVHLQKHLLHQHMVVLLQEVYAHPQQ